MTEQIEIWKDIQGGTRRRYQVSNLGNVQSISRFGKTKMLKKIQHKSCWYSKVNIWYNTGQKTRPVAQLVAEAFIRPQNESYCVV